jgi:hypothetical protein
MTEKEIPSEIPFTGQDRIQGVHGNSHANPCGLLRRANSVSAMTFSLRKEVIQPQVLLRLPCYDFTPIMNHTLGGCLPCGLAHRLLVSSTFVM